jgi:hypothetical protein
MTPRTPALADLLQIDAELRSIYDRLHKVARQLYADDRGFEAHQVKEAAEHVYQSMAGDSGVWIALRSLGAAEKRAKDSEA